MPHDPVELGGKVGEPGSGRGGCRVDERDVEDGVFCEVNAIRIQERHSGASIVIYRQGLAGKRQDRTVTAWIGRKSRGIGVTTGVGLSLKDRTTV